MNKNRKRRALDLFVDALVHPSVSVQRCAALSHAAESQEHSLVNFS